MVEQTTLVPSKIMYRQLNTQTTSRIKHGGKITHGSVRNDRRTQFVLILGQKVNVPHCWICSYNLSGKRIGSDLPSLQQSYF